MGEIKIPIKKIMTFIKKRSIVVVTTIMITVVVPIATYWCFRIGFFQAIDGIGKDDWLSFVGTYIGTIVAFITILVSVELLRKQINEENKLSRELIEEENRYRVMPYISLVVDKETTECTDKIVVMDISSEDMTSSISNDVFGALRVANEDKEIDEDNSATQVFICECANEYPAIGLIWRAETYKDSTKNDHTITIAPKSPVCSVNKGQQFRIKLVVCLNMNCIERNTSITLIATFKDIMDNVYDQYFIMRRTGNRIRIVDVKAPKLMHRSKSIR